MKNEIEITEFRTRDLKLSENKLDLEVFLRNAYGEWSTTCWLEISNSNEMMEEIFEHVMKIQEPTRGFSKHKIFKIIIRRLKNEIIDREGTVEKAGVFFNKFMQAKEKYKNSELGEDELRLLETEEIDFEDENLGVLNMLGEERLLYFAERARDDVIDDMPYSALDSLERAFKLDADVGLEEKYLERLEELRDTESTDLPSHVEALIKDVENDLKQAGYDLNIGLKYMIGEDADGTDIKIELKPLKDVLLPDSARTTPSVIKEGEEDEYLGMLLTIDGAIASFYRENPKLKDIDVIKALKNLKKDLTKEYPAGCLEDQIRMRIHVIASYKGYTKKEVQICLARILKSVKLHRRTEGVRGYLNFIIDYA